MPRKITISWDASEGSVDGYNIYRTTASGAEYGAPINGPALVKDNSFVDEVADLGASPVYFYKVSAVFEGRESAASLESRSPALPAAPKNIKASEEASDEEKRRVASAKADADAKAKAQASLNSASAQTASGSTAPPLMERERQANAQAASEQAAADGASAKAPARRRNN